MTATGAIYPRVAKCGYCGISVLRDNRGTWIHTGLTYTCRDRWGTLMSTTTEPASFPAAPRYAYPIQLFDSGHADTSGWVDDVLAETGFGTS